MIHPAPKPARAAPKPKKQLQRSGRIERTAHMKRPRRDPEEFARVYHSSARCVWIKSLPCLLSGVAVEQSGGPCGGVVENAHTANGGLSRKGPAFTIVPLCKRHHYAFDHYGYPQNVRAWIIAQAAVVEAAWQKISEAPSAPPRAEHGK